VRIVSGFSRRASAVLLSRTRITTRYNLQCSALSQNALVARAFIPWFPLVSPLRILFPHMKRLRDLMLAGNGGARYGSRSSQQGASSELVSSSRMFLLLPRRTSISALPTPAATWRRLSADDLFRRRALAPLDLLTRAAVSRPRGTLLHLLCESPCSINDTGCSKYPAALHDRKRVFGGIMGTIIRIPYYTRIRDVSFVTIRLIVSLVANIVVRCGMYLLISMYCITH